MYFTTTQQSHLSITLTDIVRYHLFPSTHQNILPNSIFVPQISSLQIINIPQLFQSLLPFREHVHYILCRFIPDLSAAVLSNVIDFCINATSQSHPKLPISPPDSTSTTNTSTTPKHRIFDHSHIFDERWFNAFVRNLIQTILNLLISFQLQHLSSQQQEQVFQIQSPSTFSGVFFSRPDAPPSSPSAHPSGTPQLPSSSSHSFTTIKILLEVIANVAIISWLYLEILRSPSINPQYPHYVRLFSRHKSISNVFLLEQNRSENFILSTHHHCDVFNSLEKQLDQLTLQSTLQQSPNIFPQLNITPQNVHLHINSHNSHLSQQHESDHSNFDPVVQSNHNSFQPTLHDQQFDQFRNTIEPSYQQPSTPTPHPHPTHPIVAPKPASGPSQIKPQPPPKTSLIATKLNAFASTFNYPPIILPCTSATVHIAAFYANILSFPIIPINHVFSQHLFDIDINDTTNELISLTSIQSQPTSSSSNSNPNPPDSNPSLHQNNQSSPQIHKIGNLYPICDGPLSLGLLLRIWQRYLIKNTQRLIFPALPIPLVLSFLTKPCGRLDALVDQYLFRYYSRLLNRHDSSNTASAKPSAKSSPSSPSHQSRSSKPKERRDDVFDNTKTKLNHRQSQSNQNNPKSPNPHKQPAFPFHIPYFPPLRQLFTSSTLQYLAERGLITQSTSSQQQQLPLHNPHLSVSRTLHQISPHRPQTPLPQIATIVIEYLQLFRFLNFALSNRRLSSPITALISPIFPFRYTEQLHHALSNQQHHQVLNEELSTANSSGHNSPKHSPPQDNSHESSTFSELHHHSSLPGILQCFTQPLRSMISQISELISFCPFYESNDDEEDNESDGGDGEHNKAKSERDHFSEQDGSGALHAFESPTPQQLSPGSQINPVQASSRSDNRHNQPLSSTQSDSDAQSQSQSTHDLRPSNQPLSPPSFNSTIAYSPPNLSAQQPHESTTTSQPKIHPDEEHGENAPKLVVPANVTLNYLMQKRFIDFTIPSTPDSLNVSNSATIQHASHSIPQNSDNRGAQEQLISVDIDSLHPQPAPALDAPVSSQSTPMHPSKRSRSPALRQSLAILPSSPPFTSPQLNNFNALAERLIYQNVGSKLHFSTSIPSPPHIAETPSSQPTPEHPAQESPDSNKPKLHVTASLLNTPDPYISAIHVCFHQIIHQTLTCCSNHPQQQESNRKRRHHNRKPPAKSPTSDLQIEPGPQVHPMDTSLCYIPCVTVYQYQHGTQSFNIQYTILHILLTLSNTIFKHSQAFQDLFNPLDAFALLNTATQSLQQKAAPLPSTLSFSFSLLQPPPQPSPILLQDSTRPTVLPTSSQNTLKAPLPPSPLLSLLTLHVYRYSRVMQSFMRFMSIAYTHADIHARFAAQLRDSPPKHQISQHAVHKPSIPTQHTAEVDSNDFMIKHVNNQDLAAKNSTTSFPFSLSASPGLLIIHFDVCSTPDHIQFGQSSTTSPNHSIVNKAQSVLEDALFYSILYPQLGLPTTLSSSHINSSPLVPLHPHLATDFFFNNPLSTHKSAPNDPQSVINLKSTPSIPIATFKSQYPRKLGSLFFTTDQSKLKSLAHIPDRLTDLHRIQSSFESVPDSQHVDPTPDTGVSSDHHDPTSVVVPGITNPTSLNHKIVDIDTIHPSKL